MKLPTKNITKDAMFPRGMDHMGLNEYQNNTGWNSWNALGPMGQGFPSGGMQGAFGSNPYSTQPSIQGNEAIMQSQQQLNNMNTMEQQPGMNQSAGAPSRGPLWLPKNMPYQDNMQFGNKLAAVKLAEASNYAKYPLMGLAMGAPVGAVTGG